MAAVAAVKVPIVRPDLGDSEVDAVARVIRSGWVMQGPEVASFEQEFATAVGAPHAVAVSSGTAALELALRALDVAGKRVITVSHTFIATVNAIVAAGGEPVLVDVEEDNWGMDPAALARAIGPRAGAVLCVHQLGMPCDLAGVIDAANGVPVIEDAACAAGSEISWEGSWERIGRPRGVMATFSFHPRKVITTGDGGMVTTANAALAERVRLLRQHAMGIPDTIRHHSNRVVFEEYSEPAFNFRMTDVQAAMGRPQLARLPASVAERRRIAEHYRKALAGNPVLTLPGERPSARSNWQSYPVRLRDGCGVSQVDALQFLMDRGIGAKRGCSNVHQEPAYRDTGRALIGPGGLPVSERLRDSTIVLPLFHGMTADEQHQVIDAVRELGGR